MKRVRPRNIYRHENADSAFMATLMIVMTTPSGAQTTRPTGFIVKLMHALESPDTQLPHNNISSHWHSNDKSDKEKQRTVPDVRKVTIIIPLIKI